MKSEKIALASERYALEITNENKQCESLRLEREVAIAAFQAGADLVNDYWQEKTRWKLLEKEPPTNYTYDKMYLLRTESGSPYLVPLPYKESIKEFLNNGFIEWKEID